MQKVTEARRYAKHYVPEYRMDCHGPYAAYLEKFLKLDHPVRVVCDASDGVAGVILKYIRNKNLQIIPIHSEPDGKFPSHGPDPWKEGAMHDLKETVLKTKSDFGAIFDADGDRVFFVDNRARLVPQEAIVLLLAGEFPPPYLIDVRMGGLIKKSDLPVTISRVGHYFIKNTMAKKKIKFGMEFSGHLYFENDIRGELSYFDSGLRALMHMANAVVSLHSKNESLAAWIDALPKYFRMPEMNFTVKNKTALLEKLADAYKGEARRVTHLDGITAEFKDWWFNARVSNTEPLLRLNIEANGPEILGDAHN